MRSLLVTVFAKVLFGQTERKCPDKFNEVLKKGYSPAGGNHTLSQSHPCPVVCDQAFVCCGTSKGEVARDE